jgi:ParB family chromosome partitioning protein
MSDMPLLLDADDAIEYYSRPGLTDAERAFVVAFLSTKGYRNKSIRNALGIKNVYTVSHLSRAGSLTDAELTLWHRNPHRIKLGHIRAVASLPAAHREDVLRGLLVRRRSVRDLVATLRGDDVVDNADIKRYEQVMGDVLGRVVKVRFDDSGSGSLSLSFHGLDDLDDITQRLGFDPKGRM